jgi:MFS family permease
LLCLGDPWLFLLGALLIGFGYGPITPASSHMLALSTPAKNLSLVFSIKQTGVPLGGVLAGLLAPLLEEAFGWRGALLTVAISCVLCSAAAQSLRSSHDDARRASHPLGVGTFGELARLLHESPPLRTLALSSFCFSTFQLSITTYLVTYLHETFGYSLLAAGAAMSLVQASGVVGRVFWGLAADRHLGAITTLVALACTMTLAGLLLGTAPVSLPAPVLMVVICLAGATGLGWNGTFLAEVTRQAPAGLAGRATGAILACTFAGVVVGPPLFGVVASLTGSYRLAFGAVILGPALAAALLYWRRGKFAGHR